jgi:hypothetical protein
VICAVVAAIGLVTPSREVLIERWLAGNPAHASIRLESRGAAAAPSFDLRALAERELNTPFRYQLTGPPGTVTEEPLWVRALQWLGDRWQEISRRLFGRIHVSSSQAAGIGVALLIVIGLGLALVAVLLARAVMRTRSPASVASAPMESPADPQAWYREACDAASRGDYGGASLLLFAATVALLAQRSTISVRRSATVGDLRRDLRAENAKLVPSFDTVAGAFVERAYAEREVDEPRWRRAREAFDALRLALSAAG